MASTRQTADGRSLERFGDRDVLDHLFREALETVEAGNLLRTNSTFDGTTWRYRSEFGAIDFDIPVDARLVVVGAGKAAASIAKGLEDVFGDRISDGCIVVKYGHVQPLTRIRQVEAGHPLPDANGLAGTRQVLDALQDLRPNDRVIVALSGGASSLLVSPVDGVTLEDKARATDLLIRSGATIGEINAVRKALSRAKGGRLLDSIAPARSLTLLISDVPDGSYATIGSGPTIIDEAPAVDPLRIFEHYRLMAHMPRPVIEALAATRPARMAHDPADHQVLLLASSAHLVRNLTQIAERVGLQCRVLNGAMHGNTHAEAREFVAAALCLAGEAGRDTLLISAGETTLEVPGNGKGGRNQEFALYAARLIDGAKGVTIMAAGTDGTDGPTDAAGACVDGATWSRAQSMGLDPAGALADNDSFTLFESTGDLVVTGPSGTNVMDVVLALVKGIGMPAGRRA